jgi:hypothetical protein
MQLVDWFRQVGVSVFLLWGMGMAVSVFLALKSYRHDAVLVAPFLGFGLISGICHYLGALGLSVEQFAWVLALFVGVLLVVAVIRRRSELNLPCRSHVNVKRSAATHWRIITICLAAYVIAMLPLIILGYLTTVGATIDGISYAVRSEYLREAALVRPEVPAGQPFYGWVAAQIDLIRVGDVYFVALVGALSATRSYQLLTTTAALFFALMPASVYVLSRRTFHLKEPAALLAAGLVGIHNLLLWSLNDNFLSQTIGMSLFPLTLSFGIEAVRTLRVPETAAFAVLFTALISVYPVYALPVVAVLVLYGVVEGARSVQRRRRGTRPVVPMREEAPAGHLPAQSPPVGGEVAPVVCNSIARLIVRYLVWTAGVLVLLLLCNGVAVRRAFNELGFVGRLLDPERARTFGQGNILVFPPLFEVVGLIAHVNSAYNLGVWQLADWALVASAVAVGALIGVGWWRLPAQGRLASAIVLASTCGLALHQRFGINPPQGYPYGYFKAVSLVTLSVYPLLAQGFMVALEAPRLRCFAWILLVGIVGLNAVNTSLTLHYVLGNRIVVPREVIEIERGLRHLPPEEWILLDLHPSVTQHWIGYLLKGHRIHYRERLFTQHIYDHTYPPPTYQYALIERQVDALRAGQQVLDEPWYNPRMYEVVWSNGVYDLRRRVDAALTDLRPVGGQRYWHAGENLQISVGAPHDRMGVRLGTDRVIEGSMDGQPQTLQLTLLVLTTTAKIRFAEDLIECSPGIWLVDIALRDPDSILLENVGTAPVLLHRIKALEVNTGDPGRLLELQQRPDGFAFVSQSHEGTRLEYEVTLLRPAGDKLFVYRLGIQAFDPSTLQYFGVWRLDFSGPERLQRGTFEIDLATESAWWTIEGVQVPVNVRRHEVESGDFEVYLVWWRLDLPSYLSLYPSAHFKRDSKGLRALDVNGEIPVTILALPR